MKSFVTLCALVIAGSAAAAAEPAPLPMPQQIPVNFTRVYAPMGFDSNDVVQIVVEGAFPNSCYRPGFSGVRVAREGHRIEVSATAFKYAGTCLEVIVPFDHVINLGVLEPGEYTVVQTGAAFAGLGKFTISPAKSADPDDYDYAPVSQAFLRQDGRAVTISGEFGLSCASLDKVLVKVEPTSIVVQPIAKIDKSRGCAKGLFPFERTVAVPNARPGRYLLHVRSMNGKAVNSIVDVH